MNFDRVTSMRGPISDLRRTFDGDEEAMRCAIEDAKKDTEMLESWATECLRRENHLARPFRISEMPGKLQEKSRHALAVAFLTATIGTKEKGAA